MRTDRRAFLKSSLATSTLVAMGGSSVPSFLARSAHAAEGKSGEKVLVVVQLIGGNDGLNTVIPHGHDGYLRGRKSLRINAGQVLPITPEIGLHPRMGEMAKLVEQGKLAVVQGVGYPNPDRSHFRSMEIWETARTEAGALETGWLGRAIEARAARPGEDTQAFHIGSGTLPLALKAKQTEVPSLERLDQFRLATAGGTPPRSTLDGAVRIERGQDDPLLGFLRRSTLAAYDSSQRLEQVLKDSASSDRYPAYGLARRLELIARIIKAGFGTRIYYTSLDGFDTHANQFGSHAALLNELSDSVAAFHADLAADGQADRVAVLTFSEFGRRVGENASQGTDHGAAAPILVVGPVARPGLIGEHPSFDDLDDGDLKHHTDFRRVYASLLEDWLGVPAGSVVGEAFRPIDLFRGKPA